MAPSALQVAQVSMGVGFFLCLWIDSKEPLAQCILRGGTWEEIWLWVGWRMLGAKHPLGIAHG